MRKKLFLLALCAATALPIEAMPALFTDPGAKATYGNITCDAGTITGDYGSLYSRLPIYSVSSFRKSNVATTAVAMTVDLSAASQVTDNTKLLTFDSTHELGLIATPDGITGNWHGQPWGEVIPYTRLMPYPATLHRSGKHYITFTVVASGCQGSGWNGIGGIMGYDVNGELIISLPRLASADNKEFKSISINTDLVKTVSVNPKVSQSLASVASDAARQAAKVERKFLKTRGELLSPTQWLAVSIGGLLLLGGISLCCFRKGKWQ